MNFDNPFRRGEYRLRIGLIAVNTVIVMSGLALSLLGRELDLFLIRESLDRGQAPLWWIGLIPMVFGILGIAVCLTGRRMMVVAWLVAMSVIGSTSYGLVSLVGCLDSQQYGVDIMIFNNCRQLQDLCTCFLQSGNVIFLEFSTCSNIWHTTVVYVSLIVVLVFCISFCVLGAMLGCISAICLPKCRLKEFDRGLSTFIRGPDQSMRYVSESSGTYTPAPLTFVDRNAYHS